MLKKKRTGNINSSNKNFIIQECQMTVKSNFNKNIIIKLLIL